MKDLESQQSREESLDYISDDLASKYNEVYIHHKYCRLTLDLAVFRTFLMIFLVFVCCRERNLCAITYSILKL